MKVSIDINIHIEDETGHFPGLPKTFTLARKLMNETLERGVSEVVEEESKNA